MEFPIYDVAVLQKPFVAGYGALNCGAWTIAMFQQHGTRCRMWMPLEVKDPVLLDAPHP